MPFFATPAQLGAIIDIISRNALTLISLSENVHVSYGLLFWQLKFRLADIWGKAQCPISRPVSQERSSIDVACAFFGLSADLGCNAG
jgi:hypothetical protein